jgi:hypothetical protein
MGDTRFVLGYIRGSKYPPELRYSAAHGRAVVATKPCPIQLKMKVVKSDKQEMIKEYIDPPVETPNGTSDLPNPGSVSGDLPEDRFASESTEGSDWVKFGEPILYF